MGLARRARRWWMLVAGVVIGGLVSGAVAWATIPDGTGVIHGCYTTSSGTLRIIDTGAGQTCRPGEAALSWNQTGPQGPAGPQGVAGPSGPQGPAGPQGQPGTDEPRYCRTAATPTAGVEGFCRSIIRTLDPTTPAVSPQAPPSLVIGVDGKPLVIDNDSTSGGPLRVIRCGDPACTTSSSATVVAAAAGSAMAIGTDGLPHLVYTDPSSSELMYVRCTAADCSSANPPADLGTTGGGARIGAFGAIVFRGSQGLMVVTCSDDTCSSPSSPALLAADDVREVPAVSQDASSLTVAFDDISYRVQYLRCSNSPSFPTCAAPVTIDSGWQPDAGVGVALGADGLPLVSYFGSPYGAGLRVAHCVDLACSSHTTQGIASFFPSGTNVTNSSLTLGPDGLPVMAFSDGLDGIVARCLDTLCTSRTYVNFFGWLKVSVALGADGFPVVAGLTNPGLGISRAVTK